MIVTMAVLLIIVAGSITSVTYIAETFALSTSIHTIETYIETAKDYTLDHYNGSSNYGVSFSATKINLYKGTTYPGTATVLRTYNIPLGVSLKTDTFTGAYVYFQSLTSAPNGTGSFILKAFTASYTVSITATGVVNIVKN